EVSWYDTTVSNVQQTYDIKHVYFGPADASQIIINIAKIKDTTTQSETHGRDSSYNQQVMTVSNRWVDAHDAAQPGDISYNGPLPIHLARVTGSGEILEAHSGTDNTLPTGFDPGNQNNLNEQNWWDTTV